MQYLSNSNNYSNHEWFTELFSIMCYVYIYIYIRVYIYIYI